MPRQAYRAKEKGQLEKDYGHLYHGVSMNKWLQYADKACERLPSLVEAESEFELCVNFELNPKLKALLSVIDSLNPEEPKRPLGSKYKAPI